MSESDGWLLTDDELAALDDDDREELQRLLGQIEGPSWSLVENPKSQIGHILAGKVNWTLLGGSAGGSKTETMVYHARELARNVPGSTALILRTSKPELRRSFILRTIVRFAQTGDNKRAKYAERTGVVGWWWKNGSTTEFGYARRAEDAGQYLSAEYQLVCFDESTQFDPKTITMICGRLRATTEMTERGARPHALFASNPGDISHEWHRELFVDLTEYGRYVVILDVSQGFADNDGQLDWDKLTIVDRVPAPQTVADAERFTLDIDPENHLSIAFVPFGPRDNKFIDASFMRNLNTLPEMERRQKRDGDWDAFTGRYFTEFSTNTHIVAPFDVEPSWSHGIGLDWGYAAPFAAVYGMWDNDGNCWIYDEVYETKLTAPQQAALVLDKLRRTGLDGKPLTIKTRTPVADPSVFSQRGEGRSIAEQWAAAGLRTLPASNARVDGWVNVREYLRVPIDDNGVGRPRLFVFDTCSELIREIRNARQDPRHPEDVDTTGSDHALDALRYLLATRPRKRRSKLNPFGDLQGADLREAKRLDKIRRSGRSRERRYGLR